MSDSKVQEKEIQNEDISVIEESKVDRTSSSHIDCKSLTES